jgi:hypothetical protein
MIHQDIGDINSLLGRINLGKYLANMEVDMDRWVT